MEIKTYGTLLPGVKLLERKLWHDERGYFSESYKSSIEGMRGEYRQLNTARSTKNVLRGMHKQNQTKLIMPVLGVIFDVALDPVSGEWFGVELDHTRSLLIPPQYAHGYLVLSDDAIVQYIVDAPYDPTIEENLKWNGYDIEWPIIGQPILSEKDK